MEKLSIFEKAKRLSIITDALRDIDEGLGAIVGQLRYLHDNGDITADSGDNKKCEGEMRSGLDFFTMIHTELLRGFASDVSRSERPEEGSDKE